MKIMIPEGMSTVDKITDIEELNNHHMNGQLIDQYHA
jgi:hypothetical protein